MAAEPAAHVPRADPIAGKISAFHTKWVVANALPLNADMAGKFQRV